MLHKLTFIFITLTCSVASSFSQDIDTLKLSKGLYVVDLELIPIENSEQILLKWEAHPNLRTFVVEIRDENSNELTYKEKHYGKSFTFEKDGIFSVYPITQLSRGVPIEISYDIAIQNEFEPQNTARHIDIELKRAERDKKQRLLDQQAAEEAAILKEKSDFFATVRGSITFIVFGVFSLLIVLIIWLINRYKNRPIKAKEYFQRDDEFENSSF